MTVATLLLAALDPAAALFQEQVPVVVDPPPERERPPLVETELRVPVQALTVVEPGGPGCRHMCSACLRRAADSWPSGGTLRYPEPSSLLTRQVPVRVLPMLSVYTLDTLTHPLIWYPDALLAYDVSSSTGEGIEVPLFVT